MRRALSRTRTGEDIIGSLRFAPFRWLWASGLMSGFAMFSSQLVLGWLALGTTGSPLAVGVVFAARVVPQMIFGLPAGALADRFSRSRLVMTANTGSGVVVGLLGLAWVDSAGALPVLVAGAFLMGAFDAVRVTAATALAFDLAGRASATNGIALSNLAAQISGIFAGLVAGYGVDTIGSTSTLLVMASVYLAGAALVSRVPRIQPVAGHAAEVRVTLKSATTLIARNRNVLLIAVVVAGTEVFAFSGMTLLPSFARDVFGIGVAGLGWLLSARAIGGTLALLAIATTTSRWRTVGAFSFLAGAFGLSLIAFAVTPNLGIALILAGVIGAAGAAVDAVGQSQLQHAVPEAERGSAMGVWMFCVGLGLVGHIEVGTLGGLLGPQSAQGLNGVALVVLAVAVAAALPAIRARQPGTADLP